MIDDLDLGDGDSDLRILDKENNVPEAKGLAFMESGFFDELAAYEGAIGRIAIAQKQRAIGQLNLTMQCRNCGMFDLKIAFGTAPKAVNPQLKLNNLFPKAV